MAIHRKPVRGERRETEGPPPKIDPKTSTVRLVSEDVRGPDNVPVHLNNFDADRIAPALSRMSIDERPQSAFGNDDRTARLHHRADEHKIPRSSLDKPLPNRPDEDDNTSSDTRANLSHRSKARDRSGGGANAIAKKSAARELGVENVVDLEDSVDTIYHRRQAPAVVQETIKQPVHEVQHRLYERDIHEHEIHHRILPVKEVEVLPARHFVEDAQGRRHEVPAHRVPGRASEHMDRLLQQSLKLDLPDDRRGAEGRKTFTARAFPGREGDYSESVNSEGTVSSEQWWVHPPVAEQASGKHKDAYEVHFD